MIHPLTNMRESLFQTGMEIPEIDHHFLSFSHIVTP